MSYCTYMLSNFYLHTLTNADIVSRLPGRSIGNCLIIPRHVEFLISRILFIEIERDSFLFYYHFGSLILSYI
jgi:hypothetical protein